MTLTIEATYENGVLRPAQPLPLKEHARVEVVIHAPPADAEPPTPEALRQAALKELLAMQLPVADWEQMEREIVRGALP